MTKRTIDADAILSRAKPRMHQEALEIQVAGPTFYQLHLLFDKHYEQQNELVDAIAERRLAAEHGDEGTNDLIVSNVIRANELHVWFVAEHVVDVPLAHAV